VAHTAIAAAGLGSPEHATALTAFEAALTVIDTVRQHQVSGPVACLLLSGQRTY